MLLPRFFRHQEAAEDARKLTKRLLESGEDAPVTQGSLATLPGDKRRLRGIPVVGGVSGTSPGTDPLAEVIKRSSPRRPEDRRIQRNPQIGRAA